MSDKPEWSKKPPTEPGWYWTRRCFAYPVVCMAYVRREYSPGHGQEWFCEVHDEYEGTETWLVENYINETPHGVEWQRVMEATP